MAVAWTAVAAIAGCSVGAAFSVMGCSPPEFTIARWMFVAAAVLLGSMTAVWAVKTDASVLSRVTLTCLMGVAVLALLPISRAFVSGREIALRPVASRPDVSEFTASSNGTSTVDIRPVKHRTSTPQITSEAQPLSTSTAPASAENANPTKRVKDFDEPFSTLTQ
jgi:hypothetical protein